MKAHVCVYDPSPLGTTSVWVNDGAVWWATCSKCGNRSPENEGMEPWSRTHPCYVEWLARTGGNPIQHGKECSEVEA